MILVLYPAWFCQYRAPFFSRGEGPVDEGLLPYRHLLIPRAGGFAFVLQALGPQLRAVLDTAIVYPEGRTGFWDLLSGRISKVIVRARKIEVPRDLLAGDYEDDPAFRERLQAWVREVWREKDELIDRLLHGAPEARRVS